MMIVVLGTLGVALAGSLLYVLMGIRLRVSSYSNAEEKRVLTLWRFVLGISDAAPGGSLRRNLRAVHTLSQQMILEAAAIDRLGDRYPQADQIRLVKRLLRRRQKTSRLEGITLALTLDLLTDPEIYALVADMAISDPVYAIRLRAIAELAARGDEGILIRITENIASYPEWFLRQLPGRFSRTSSPEPEILVRLINHWSRIPPDNRQRTGTLTLLMRISGLRHEPLLLPAITALQDDEDPNVARIAVETVTERYREACGEPRFLNSRDTEIAGASMRSLAMRNGPADLDTLLELLRSSEPDRTPLVREALVEMIHFFPATLDRIIRRIATSDDRELLQRVAPVLATRGSYLLRRKDADRIVPEILRELLRQGAVDPIIAFTSRRAAESLPPLLVNTIRSIATDAVHGTAAGMTAGLQALANGLPHEHREMLGLPEPQEEAPREPDRAGTPRLERVLLGALPVLLIAVFGGVFSFRFAPYLTAEGRTFLEIVGLAAARFNYTFLWYSLAIHTVYVALLVLAMRHHRYQAFTWQLRISRLLYDPEVLPGLTMLVPAHNEEKNIVTNVRNLLRIEYPDYRLIVINDGSADRTMRFLDEEFDLERIGITRTGNIATKRVRAVYVSRSVPNLMVVDKVGGGKADALNAGINLCTSPLFCTIDADSILEPEALIRAVYRNLMSEKEAVAVGGTILPENGCSITGGWVSRAGIPRSTVAAFQMVEYLRAFLAGRLGWARINSLSIISGAFGIFSRRRTVQAGGYLTSSGTYGRATMGEDMELVVRLGRFMREQKHPYVINFAGSAICWTEVPERYDVLYRQRRRWQRGLLETLYFHRRLLFNPRYGALGTMGLAYFVVFEVIGPFIELFGYAALLISAILGTLNYTMAVLIFAAAIGYGAVVTAMAVGMGIRATETLRRLPPGRLLLLTVLESFGFRQWSSASRVSAYFSHLFRTTGWSQPARKGIGTSR